MREVKLIKFAVCLSDVEFQQEIASKRMLIPQALYLSTDLSLGLWVRLLPTLSYVRVH